MSITMICLLVLCYLFVSTFVQCNSDVQNRDQKRILLSDPTYIQTQLLHLESEIQNLQVKTDTQQSTIEAHETTISNQQSTISDLTRAGKGVIFKRWGRKDCPDNFTMLYSGFAGGSWYNHPGSAADYQCLPPDPTWGPNKNLQVTGNIAYMYGAEYQTTWSDLQTHNHADNDVPCSVCYAASYTMMIMIPGRVNCYPGWTEAYHGDLAAGASNYEGASEYVCLDQDPQDVIGGDEDRNGKLFYHVKTSCGSLKCPPYENDVLLSCVVCVK